MNEDQMILAGTIIYWFGILCGVLLTASSMVEPLRKKVAKLERAAREEAKLQAALRALRMKHAAANTKLPAKVKIAAPKQKPRKVS